VMNDTVVKPGSDAAVVRVHGTQKAIAISTDCTPRYCIADPHEGGKQAVAECWRNITASGARPLAITNCLNFGNPEKPEIMGQIVAGLQGMAEACRALNFPIVSGNVSLYNETNGKGILPTPAIGGIGLLSDVRTHMTIALKGVGNTLLLIGNSVGHLGASVYLEVVEGKKAGAPPVVDLEAELRHGDVVRGWIESGSVLACHDISDGGVLVAVAEMALAGNIGVSLTLNDTSVGALFGEDQARYVVEVAPEQAVSLQAAAVKAGVPCAVIGATGGDEITLNGASLNTLTTLRNSHEGWLPAFMNE
jgi:phosphoribosylformylglycinamidine synthase subunit PurL